MEFGVRGLMLTMIASTRLLDWIGPVRHRSDCGSLGVETGLLSDLLKKSSFASGSPPQGSPTSGCPPWSDLRTTSLPNESAGADTSHCLLRPITLTADPPTPERSSAREIISVAIRPCRTRRRTLLLWMVCGKAEFGSPCPTRPDPHRGGDGIRRKGEGERSLFCSPFGRL